MPRRGDYLYQRKGSANWWLRLQIPPELQEMLGAKKIEKSVGTSDRAQAEIKAANDIVLHKMRLVWLRAKKAGRASELVQREYEPGEHTLSDGNRIFATEDTIHILGPDGKIIDRRPNLSQKFIKVPLNRPDANDVIRMLEKHLGPPEMPSTRMTLSLRRGLSIAGKKITSPRKPAPFGNCSSRSLTTNLWRNAPATMAAP
jgi:hypothetical protein